MAEPYRVEVIENTITPACDRIAASALLLHPIAVAEFLSAVREIQDESITLIKDLTPVSTGSPFSDEPPNSGALRDSTQGPFTLFEDLAGKIDFSQPAQNREGQEYAVWVREGHTDVYPVNAGALADQETGWGPYKHAKGTNPNPYWDDACQLIPRLADERLLAHGFKIKTRVVESWR